MLLADEFVGNERTLGSKSVAYLASEVPIVHSVVSVVNSMKR